jgi:hypothetical protein
VEVMPVKRFVQGIKFLQKFLMERIPARKGGIVRE